ncbi:MAG: shikimate kinase [Acidobacteriota bacterium]|nr:shikimate kinase [Acidobacteriota bacterium]MDH3786613.1 shikimate kinase [Acidobacteriota bacterium]
MATRPDILRPIFLLGFMGAGKSTVGPIVARHLGLPFVDTDALIESREGRSIRQIFAEDGEAVFRRLESDRLEELLGAGPAVVATGGGVYQSFSVRRSLHRHGTTVWLDVPWQVVGQRVPRGDDRPLFKSDYSPEFRAFFEKRRACYALAAVRVDAGSGSAEEVARRIVVGLGLSKQYP